MKLRVISLGVGSEKRFQLICARHGWGFVVHWSLPVGD
jgi:hypothetical protein